MIKRKWEIRLLCQGKGTEERYSVVQVNVVF